jgi:Zn-dependent protease with chaperone function
MPVYRTTAYRYPSEQVIFFLTILAVFIVIVVTAGATICLSVVFIAIMIGVAYYTNKAHHQELMKQAYAVTPQSAPQMAVLARDCIARLQPGPIELYIAPNPELNAYTFGLDNPKVVVLYSSLFNEMDADELRFILGHELGHVSLGHTWLNTLLGGMAGIPAPYGAAVILTVAFLWWNRACEYSADRAGMLACSNPNKAITALIKLGGGPGTRTPEQLAQALRVIDAEDDNILNVLTESLATHPMTIRRINQLRKYAASAEYRRLQARLNQA